jgi:hypothetical protein
VPPHFTAVAAASRPTIGGQPDRLGGRHSASAPFDQQHTSRTSDTPPSPGPVSSRPGTMFREFGGSTFLVGVLG